MLKAYLEWCSTDEQKKVLEAVIEHDSNKAAAEALGKEEEAVRKMILRIKTRAARAGFAPEHDLIKTAPEGYQLKGASTLYKTDEETGEKREVMQWVKVDKKAEEVMDSMKEVFTEFAQGIERAELIPSPKDCDPDLLCDYTIGDSHIGMYAWAREAGEDWDLAKGVDILRKGVNHLVDAAPNAHTAFILDLGDFFHADNQSNETSHSKNKLDVDGRWYKVTKAGIQCVCDLIDLALQKHEKVIYRSAIGNHNEHTAMLISIALEMRYNDEPRLEILDSPAFHNYFQFGINLLADTHGHTTKAEILPLLMATDVPDMWAATTNRVWRTGHVHHLSQKEFSGVTVITYRTLTPKDAWHAAAGYRSNRDMRCTIYHKIKGTVGMNIVNPTMLGY